MTTSTGMVDSYGRTETCTATTTTTTVGPDRWLPTGDIGEFYQHSRIQLTSRRSDRSR